MRYLDEESRLGTGADDEKQAVRSRVGNVLEDQLSMARAANNRGDRQAELKECLAVLAAGARGAQRAESLKRVCDAFDALGEPDQAQPFCDQLAQEFGQTNAARQMLQRRNAQPSAATKSALKRKLAPSKPSADQQKLEMNAPARTNER